VLVEGREREVGLLMLVELRCVELRCGAAARLLMIYAWSRSGCGELRLARGVVVVSVSWRRICGRVCFELVN
jgi:hypothetical protein